RRQCRRHAAQARYLQPEAAIDEQAAIAGMSGVELQRVGEVLLADERRRQQRVAAEANWLAALRAARVEAQRSVRGPDHTAGVIARLSQPLPGVSRRCAL